MKIEIEKCNVSDFPINKDGFYCNPFLFKIIKKIGEVSSIAVTKILVPLPIKISAIMIDSDSEPNSANLTMHIEKDVLSVYDQSMIIIKIMPIIMNELKRIGELDIIKELERYIYQRWYKLL